jgi:lysophospholipase L1-like esterase
VAGQKYFINGIGYRGPEIAPRKRPSVQRVIIVGGSSVFDQNMTDSTATQGRDWPHRVERFLKEDGFKNVEVINAGVPGHASFDALGRLYSQLWMYKPDYILFYEAWNDIKYFRDLAPERPLIVRYAPFNPGSNVFTEYQGWWDHLLSGSQLYVKLRNRYYEWATQGWSRRIGGEGVAPEGRYQSTLSAFAIEQYRVDVEMIVDLARNIGARPILITQATLVSPRNTEKERSLISYEYQLLTHSALVQAFDATYQVLRSVGSEKAVPVLDLAKDLNGRGEFFTDHVHLTAKGSEEVARRVAQSLALFLRTEPRDRKNGRIGRSDSAGFRQPDQTEHPGAF